MLNVACRLDSKHLCSRMLSGESDGTALLKALFVWLAIDLGLISVAAILCLLVEPVAIGGGIAEVVTLEPFIHNVPRFEVNKEFGFLSCRSSVI
jgi:hypothetical protein